MIISPSPYVRQDAYARAHPLQIEVDKDEYEKGTYLHPIEHGVSKEKATQIQDMLIDG